jgi:predicted AAA+ superfamily ATPase
MVIREKYLEQLRNLRDVNLIKVITGIRRAGKSTLFKQFQTKLLTSGVKQKNIIYFNLEELENAPLLNAYLLNDYIMKRVDKKQKNYVFLDGSILEKDIMTRNKIRSNFDFENLARFMFDSIGNIVSPNNIANALTTKGNKIDRRTVDNYLSHLLKRVKDFNKRILLTADIEPPSSYKGIEKINVIDWLLNN